MEEQENKQNKVHPQHAVHHTLAHSYSVYFLFLLGGVFLDLIFPVRVFKSDIMVVLGLVFLTLATLLIFWAQHTSRNLKIDSLKKESFCKGPYCYTRTPTHWGLFFLTLGFGFVLNAFFVILFTLVSFFITKYTFLRREERILAHRYGEPYLEYKKSVRF